MAELIIMLRRDPQTGKQNIVIKLNSDADALPHEHEQMHRELVEKLIGKDNVGELIVEREPAAESATPAKNDPQPERQKRGESSKFQVPGSKLRHGLELGTRNSELGT